MADRVMRLNFLGNHYELRAEETDVDASDVVGYVEGHAKEFQEKHKGLPPHKIQILMILHMAREVILLRKSLEAIEGQYKTGTDRLVTSIDEAMRDDI